MSHIILNGCHHHELVSNNLVISKSCSPFYFDIKLPCRSVEDLALYSIWQHDFEDKEADWIGKVKFDSCHPWVTIPVEVLELSPGYHMYEIKLVSRANDESISVFFSYTVQDSFPYKPYIYMNGGDQH